MTTIRTIISDAFRETGIIALGETPDNDQLDEALRRLDRMFKSLFGSELGEPLLSVNYGKAGLSNSYGQNSDLSSTINSAYVPANTRLIFNTGEAVTLSLNPTPDDGCRLGVIDTGNSLGTYNIVLNGNGRTIESGTSATLATNGLNREWFYRADLGDWVRLSDLDVDLESPLPEEFDDFLITLLAFRLNPRYGAETSTEMVETLKRMKKKFQARYRQTKEMSSEAAWYRIPSNRLYWYSSDSTNTFNRGFMVL